MTAGKASCITSLIASTLLVSALWSQADVPVPAPDPVAPVAPAVQQVSPQETDPAPQPAPQTQTPLDAPAVEAPPANTAVPSAPANVGPSPSAAPLVEPPASIPATAQETPKGKRDKKNRGGKTAAKRVGPSQSETEPEFKITSDVELVLLDVSVKDSQGGFVSGLQKDHFKVFENRLPQDVKTFTAQDAPVTVGLVVDNSGSVRPKKAEIVTAALTFVTQSNPDRKSVV